MAPAEIGSVFPPGACRICTDITVAGKLPHQTDPSICRAPHSIKQNGSHKHFNCPPLTYKLVSSTSNILHFTTIQHAARFKV
jgi:hypothetical protein